MNNLSKLRTDGYRDKGDTASLTEPKICGYFSINCDREYLADTSQLKYLYLPSRKVHLDLRNGYESVKRKSVDPTDDKINNLLRWILRNSNEIRAPSDSNRWLDPDFVCFRGRLMTLFSRPFEKKEGWIISACKWRGTIYLCAFDTEKKKMDKKQLSDKMLEIFSWGFKFEQYLLSDAPNEEPDTSEPVDETEEFCCIFKSQLGDNKLLYGAEMDGVSSDVILKEPIDFNRVEFVELKTSRIPQNKYHDITFRKYKLLKWWSQSFLVGTDKVLCGFRTDNGIVKELKSFKVREMPHESKGFWNPDQCLNFCDDFLNFVKSTVVEDYDKYVYKFDWEPGQEVRMEKVDPQSKYAILPQWFIDQAERYDSGREFGKKDQKQKKTRWD